MFAYCGNNPISRADSCGSWWHIAVGAIIGGVSSFVSSLVTGYIENGEMDLEAAAISGLFGIASGMLAATGFGLATQVIGGAIISAAEDVATQAYECMQKDEAVVIDGFRVLGSAIIGGVTSKGNGVTKSTSKYLHSQADSGMKRIFNALAVGGYLDCWSEIKSTLGYYFKHTAKLFYKPLANDTFASFCDDVKESVINTVFGMGVITAS